MEYLITGIVFLLIFSVIIIIHEGGHFWAAIMSGIKVEEFGFGLPPRIAGWKKKKSGVLYSLNWIPFGGFVRMLGEDDHDKKALKDPRAFPNRPLWGRIFTVCAGVIMNFFLGWMLLTIGYSVGMKPIILDEIDQQKVIANGGALIDDTGVLVSGIIAESPADKADILPGDFITGIDVTPVKTRDEFLAVKNRGLMGKDFHLSVVRKEYNKEGDVLSSETLLKRIAPDEQGNLGVYLSDLPLIIKLYPVRYSPPIAAYEAARDVKRLSQFTVVMLKNIVVSIVSRFTIPEGVGGPVAIAKITHYFVGLGEVMEVVKFAALLSISIAVLNIMPFPALDGGRLVFLLFELVFRRRPLPKWEPAIHATGLILLLIFLFFITWKDIFTDFGF